ncbi:MAG: hypothetical protein MUF19_01495 [Candidatus Pacebacteria bacterium]|jgi:hypothetical protein|nr:hypothetical protein [Candidatus Paceibacterota bacterium]
MQKISTNVEALHRVVAMLVAAAVTVVSVGFYSTASAANLAEVSNTLSDSDVSALSNHTIEFSLATSSAGFTSGQTITVEFDTTGSNAFDLSAIAIGDLDISINGSDRTIVAGAPAANQFQAAINTTTDVITFTSGGGTAVGVAGDDIVIRVGTNAAGGTNRVTNPTAGSYEFLVTAGTVDTGRTRVAILDNVDVTAIVNTSFTFVVDGLATSTAVNGTTTTGSTTPSAIPFGVLTAGEIKTMAQRLSVTTNARNGFVVTVEQDQNLLSSTGADIDGFIDGAYTNTPSAWVAPTNNIGNENTWGHWGLTSEDSDLNSDEFGSALFVAASTTPRQIFSHTGPADGTTADIGRTQVGYQIQITPLQEAGDDYNTILTYIATPTF